MRWINFTKHYDNDTGTWLYRDRNFTPQFCSTVAPRLPVQPEHLPGYIKVIGGSVSAGLNEERKNFPASFVMSCRQAFWPLVMRFGWEQFVSGQLYGRAVWVCMGHVTSHAYAPGRTSIGGELARSLERSLAALFMDKPRTVHKSRSATWYVFTDARYKPEEGSNKAGFGGAL